MHQHTVLYVMREIVWILLQVLKARRTSESMKKAKIAHPHKPLKAVHREFFSTDLVLGYVQRQHPTAKTQTIKQATTPPILTRCGTRNQQFPSSIYSSSELSSSVAPPAAAAFLAGFFFFLFLLLEPVFLASGCSRILRISSSVIFLSVLHFATSRVRGALRRVRPFLVMAA